MILLVLDVNGRFPLLKEVEADHGRHVYAHFMDKSELAVCQLQEGDLLEALQLLKEGVVRSVAAANSTSLLWPDV